MVAPGAQAWDDRAMTSPDETRPDAALTHQDTDETAAYRLRRLRRISVKGYSRLKVWALHDAR